MGEVFDKWRGVLGGLEEQKDVGSSGAPVRRLRVRRVPEGFAVFDRGEVRLSEIHATLDDAIREAESWAGEGGVVFVENDTGHVVQELHCTRLR